MADYPGRMLARLPLARQAGAVVVGVVFVLFVIWLVLLAPRLLVPTASEADLRDVPAEARWQARDNRLKLQNDVRTTLLQGLGGLAVLVGAFFTYRQLRIAREGQVTERFTRAIDQLGHENLDVRLGGIYGLERIAIDSPQDRATVAEVLTAFVRGHSPWPPSRPHQPTNNESVMRYGWLSGWAADVQAALTVLGRRKAPTGPAERLDLRSADLRRADLRGARLQHADLFLSSLQEAALRDAQLEGADLAMVSLVRADLVRAQLQDSDLRGAVLEDADLGGAQLQGAWCDSRTVWPDGFDWKAAKVRFIDR